MVPFGSEKYFTSAYKKIDATPIAAQLYQGSVPPSGPALKDARFSMLVLAAREHQPRSETFPGIKVVHVPLRDNGAPSVEELAAARRAASMVSDEIRRGGKVLVTCLMGRNRSGLVTALALHDLYGFSGGRAVDMIKTMRPFALTNTEFVRLLSKMPSGKGRR